ncbi:response regulator transcription factor [Paeniglutamicibacter sp. ZC-3]|uniref:response regulator transcription factor n=1 Tax=Paeniglutamicibacter sp. ZC-3 TaxID=2986919 RepID=UPI0021F6EC9E|nr:response regulator transcription factor [Paeniglutamicibacter sp. ZC-3]MCV9994153.1 response regulator transcription factor [Paeniglutamicibacter sp. ZC-3]
MSQQVLILDDHTVFVELLQLALNNSPGISCKLTARTIAEAEAVAARHDFTVAIVDVQLPDGSGIDAVSRLRELRPDSRIVVLTANPRAQLAHAALAAGACAFLAKDGSLEEVIRAVSHANATHPVITRNLVRRKSAEGGLTPREQEVLELLGQGLSAAQIAVQLSLSLYTVRDHIKSVLAKLGCRSQLDAVSKALRLGLLTVAA